MNSFKMSTLYKFVVKQFVYIPKIQFLGRRTRPEHQTDLPVASPRQESQHKSQEFHDTDIFLLSRPGLTEEEISVVNNGGAFDLPDWNQVKTVRF